VPESVRLRAANYEAMRLAFMRLRSQAGISFDRLAERTGVSRMALINIEHGVNRGSLDTWHRISQALGVPLSDLVARLDDPPSRTFVVAPKVKKAVAQESPAKKAVAKKAATKTAATKKAVRKKAAPGR
jgi:putative transcriptional regulator